MKKILLALLALSALAVAGGAYADGEWLRTGPVWFKNTVFTGSSKVTLTNATGNLATTTGAFSGNTSVGGTLSVTGATTLTGATTAAAVSMTSNTNSGSTKWTSAGAYAATGSAQADAIAITTPVAAVTATVTTRGAILPAGATGLVQVVGSLGATGFKLYPASGGVINTAGTDTAFTVAAGKQYFCAMSSATQWLCAGN